MILVPFPSVLYRNDCRKELLLVISHDKIIRCTINFFVFIPRITKNTILFWFLIPPKLLRTKCKLSLFLVAPLLLVTWFDGLLAVRVKSNWEVVKAVLDFFGWFTWIGYLSDVVKSILTPSTRFKFDFFWKHSWLVLQRMCLIKPGDRTIIILSLLQ